MGRPTDVVSNERARVVDSTSVKSRIACPLVALAFLGCGENEPLNPGPTLTSDRASVKIGTQPFELTIRNEAGDVVLSSLGSELPAAMADEPYFQAQTLPGWDGYLQGDAPFRPALDATVSEESATHAVVELEGEGVALTLRVELAGARVRLSTTATGDVLNKIRLSFATDENEHFFGMGERFATVDHKGFSLYSYAEEGALGKGENMPPSETNPGPHGPSMTYFPVPFFLSNHGYAVHLATTYRSELDFGAGRHDAWRVAVSANHFDATVYVESDPLAALEAYTEDSGRPTMPAPWVFGPRRRVSPHVMVDGIEEFQKMRDEDLACTGIDDAVHFLPALSQVGREAELAAWTDSLHAAGYKAMAYNNPYVAQNDEKAAADYAFGKEHGYFVKLPSGEPALTEFISGKLLTIAAVDLTNPDAVLWYQSLLKRDRKSVV